MEILNEIRSGREAAEAESPEDSEEGESREIKEGVPDHISEAAESRADEASENQADPDKRDEGSETFENGSEGDGPRKKSFEDITSELHIDTGLTSDK